MHEGIGIKKTAHMYHITSTREIDHRFDRMIFYSFFLLAPCLAALHALKTQSARGMLETKRRKQHTDIKTKREGWMVLYSFFLLARCRAALNALKMQSASDMPET